LLNYLSLGQRLSTDYFSIGLSGEGLEKYGNITE
jgi:hypothetical protein